MKTPSKTAMRVRILFPRGGDLDGRRIPVTHRSFMEYALTLDSAEALIGNEKWL